MCRIEEFAPSAEQVQTRPDLKDEVEKPMILLIAADR